MTLLKRAYLLLDAQERRKAWILLGISMIVALFEMVSTLSLMPFLAVLADPGQIERNGTLAWLHGLSGLTDTTDFLILLAALSFTLLVTAAGVRALGQYAVIRFGLQRAASISRRLLDAYLRRSYDFFLARNSSDLNRKILQESTALSNQIYTPLTKIVSQTVLAATLLTLLIVVNPGVALIAAAILGACYAGLFLVVRQILYRLGQRTLAANKRRFRLASEALGGIKTVKINGTERTYLGRFAKAAHESSDLQARSQALGTLPRYGIEAVAFGGILLLALVLLVEHRNAPGGAIGQLLPLLGVYAFAGYRLLPALQNIYQSLSQLRYGRAVFESVSEDLAALESLPPLPTAPVAPLAFTREIALDAVGFSHQGSEAATLKDISLTIPKGTSLGIVGTTGAGKTTLMDLILGLLPPDAGRMRVDDTALTPDNLRAWQANLGYVPQDIFLLDASIAENIAFGEDGRTLDMDRVRLCADMAQLTEFVETQLPNGFQTMTGERGVRLSGGQRQRIGIARALYRDPDILVFDEATSALDTVTEKAVVGAIDTLSDTKTILIVAHRLSTVQDCDQILVLDRGRMIGLGSYDELLKSNAAFRKLAGASAAA